MVSLDSHNLTRITVTRKLYEDFIVFEITGIDEDGIKTKVNFFSNDMTMRLPETEDQDRRDY